MASGPGPHLKVRRRLRKAWQYVVSYAPSARAGKLFSQVRTFCLFIGYPRSGHTLVGSLVDAHERAVIANELNVIGHVKRGFSAAQIYTLILANSRALARKGRVWTGYSYAVPNQWQGRFTTLEVMGDKRGAGTIRQLRTNPGLFDRLQRTIDADIRFIHVIRNPFDNISTMARRHRWTPEHAAAYYFGLCRSVAELKAQTGPRSMLDVWHERLIERPEDEIAAICAFLNLEARPEYLIDCASIVFRAPKETRFEMPWPPALVESVRSSAAAIPWLAHYTFES